MLQDIFNSIDVIRAEMVTSNSKPPSTLLTAKLSHTELQNSDSTLQQQLAAASSTILIRNETIETLKSENAKARFELDEKDRAILSLRQRYASAAQLLDETQAKLADAEAARASDQRHLNQLSERMIRCSKEAKLYKDDAATLQQQFASIKAATGCFSAKIDELTSHNQQLESQLAEMSLACSKLMHLRQENDTILSEVQTLRSQNQSLESTLSELQSWCASCSPEIDRLMDHAKALEGELESTRAQLRESSNTVHELEKRLLTRELQLVVLEHTPCLSAPATCDPASLPWAPHCASCEATKYEADSLVAVLTSEVQALEQMNKSLILDRVAGTSVAIDQAKCEALGSIPDHSAAMIVAEKQQQIINAMQDAITQSTDEVGRLREHCARLDAYVHKLSPGDDRPRQCMTCVLPLDPMTHCASCLKCGSQFHPSCVGAVAGQKILCPLHRQATAAASAASTATRGRGRR